MSTEAKGYTVHPMADKFPLLPPVEFEELKESIATFGQLEPIVVDGKTLLDGRNRYDVTIELGIEPRVTKFSTFQKNSPGLTPEQFIYHCNIHRRHLTLDQRLQLEAVFLPYIRAENAEAKAESLVKARQAKTEKSENQDSGSQRRDTKTMHANSTAGKLGARAGVSRHKAEQAIKIEAVPDLADKVRKGELTLLKAIKELEQRNKQLNATQQKLPGFESQNAQATQTQTSDEPHTLKPEVLSDKTNRWWEPKITKFLGGIHRSQWQAVLEIIIDDCSATLESLSPPDTAEPGTSIANINR